MGRPIKKIFMGEAGYGGTSGAGEGIASITLGGVNNSTGATALDVLTISAPDITGTQAAGTVASIYADGALLEGVTTFAAGGTGIDGGGSAAEVLSGLTADGDTNGAVFTITKANTDTVTDYSDITVEITTIGSGYAIDDTLTFLGTIVTGGGTAANDLVLTIADFVTAGTIATVTLGTAGSGYLSTPTVAQGTGVQGTLTLTAALTSANTSVIACSAWVPGGASAVTGDMKAQKGTHRYSVTTAQGTGVCELVQAVPAEGEMTIIATDFDDNTYYVSKLMNRTVTVTQKALVGGGAFEFADGAKVKWAIVAETDVSVKITQS